ncbi:glycosyltransferase family 4 protein [Ferroplasma acidiphilum]|uniref:glycosyltransferase family 4 protein n=1 Tax=Ferroplasma acidiphilum TaxID=74969 RepID=UPI0023F4560C|nr:glycosyltransferase family 4 protein [Ferroplasma acidiphilum]
MEKKKTLDYLFITWGKPFSSSSGAVNKQIYYIANSLARDGATVGILYMSYSYISNLYGFSKKNSRMDIFKGIAGRILYSKMLGKIYLNRMRRHSEVLIDDRILFFLSNYKLPALKIKRLVTSYWWGVLVPDKRNMVENIYFLLYHDYSVDIQNSNPENLKYLSKANSISRKIAVNPLINKNFDQNIPLVKEGINLDEYKSSIDFDSKDKLLMLVPLRLNPAKGAKYAIDALKLIHNKYPDISISAFGDYNLPLPEYIQFHYNINQKSLKKLYGDATFFILPSIEEGIPEPLIEAMASGCVTISTACGGPETVIVHGQNGFLVPIKNPEKIFWQFAILMEERIDLKRISESAKATAMEYDINKTYTEFLDAIKFYES